MKKAPRAGGQHHERDGKTVRDANVAHAPCPFSTDCNLVALYDADGRIQAFTCRTCTMLELRSSVHYDLTGTPGLGL